MQYVAPLKNSKDSKISTDAEEYLKNKALELKYEFPNFNLSSNKANKVLKKYGFK